MYRWQSESSLLGRYLLSGVVNTIFGFALIVFLVWLGVSVYLSNILGYITGLILSFCTSKKWVFHARGRQTAQFIKYLVAFVTSVALNLCVLQFSLQILILSPYAGQFFGACAYTASMYVLARFWVFSQTAPAMDLK